MFWMLDSAAGSLSWSADWRLRSAPWRWRRGRGLTVLLVFLDRCPERAPSRWSRSRRHWTCPPRSRRRRPRSGSRSACLIIFPARCKVCSHAIGLVGLGLEHVNHQVLLGVSVDELVLTLVVTIARLDDHSREVSLVLLDGDLALVRHVWKYFRPGVGVFPCNCCRGSRSWASSTIRFFSVSVSANLSSLSLSPAFASMTTVEKSALSSLTAPAWYCTVQYILYNTLGSGLLQALPFSSLRVVPFLRTILNFHGDVKSMWIQGSFGPFSSSMLVWFWSSFWFLLRIKNLWSLRPPSSSSPSIVSFLDLFLFFMRSKNLGLLRRSLFLAPC